MPTGSFGSGIQGEYCTSPSRGGSKKEIRFLWPPCLLGTHIVKAWQRQLKLWIRVISIPFNVPPKDPKGLDSIVFFMVLFGKPAAASASYKPWPLCFHFVSLSGEKNPEWRKSQVPDMFSQIVMRKESSNLLHKHSYIHRLLAFLLSWRAGGEGVRQPG